MKTPKTPGLLALILLLVNVIFSSAVFADVETDPVLKEGEVGDKTGFFVEYINFQDYVYSRSKKTELGDAVRVDMALRYQWDPNTFGRIRFETDPNENSINNKTSKFEFLAGHKIEGWELQMDAEILGDDTSKDVTSGSTNSGNTSVGLDLDSELTFVKYNMSALDVTFYPFNFDGEVGHEFKTRDVTRIYFIENTPSVVDRLQANGESINTKTIPGLEFGVGLNEDKSSRIYAGVGAASFLYPANEDFALPSSLVADRWQRKEDIGYKAGIEYKSADFRLDIKYVGHTESDKTGSLIEEAASIYAIARVGGMILVEPEIGYTKAGDNAFQLNRSGRWFDKVSPFRPIYTDYYGDRQDWLGKTDFAYGLRIGYETEKFVPYVSYKHQGPHFVYRDRESADQLRTSDYFKSHGGLDRFAVGAFFYSGKFLINPHVEGLFAQNPVFSDSSDVQNDRLLASFRREDYSVKLTVSYSFGPSTVFRP